MKLCRFLHPRPVTGGPQRQPVQAEGGNNGVALLRSLCAAVALVACALWLSNPADVIAQAGQPTDASYEVGCGGPPGPGCPEGCTPGVEIDPNDYDWFSTWAVQYSYTSGSGNGIVPVASFQIDGVNEPGYEDCQFQVHDVSGVCTSDAPSLSVTTDPTTGEWALSWTFSGPLSQMFDQPCPGPDPPSCGGTYTVISGPSYYYPAQGSSILVPK
jgi:hypothetical protein